MSQERAWPPGDLGAAVWNGPDADGAALLEAATLDELHVLLIAYGRRQRTTHEAEQALSRHHPAAPDAITTARLMLTDRRWDRHTDRLLHALTGTGLLAESELDDLARELLTAEHLTVQLDGRLFEGGLVITVEEDGSLGRVEQEPARPNPEPVAAHRTVPPQLRRWAAERTTRRTLLPSAETRALLDALPSQDRGVGMLGVLQAYATLSTQDQTSVLDEALVHGSGRVRATALLLLAQAGDRERAELLAAQDRDAKVRTTFAPRPAEPETLF